MSVKKKQSGYPWHNKGSHGFHQGPFPQRELRINNFSSLVTTASQTRLSICAKRVRLHMICVQRLSSVKCGVVQLWVSMILGHFIRPHKICAKLASIGSTTREEVSVLLMKSSKRNSHVETYWYIERSVCNALIGWATWCSHWVRRKSKRLDTFYVCQL